MAKTNILEMHHIVKEFPGVKALDHVNIQVQQGHIHALVGENGAGKSTLMNVLSGIYPYGTYDGDIIYENQVCQFKNIKESEREGIVIIHQELALNPYMTIAENIFLGNEQQSKGVMNWNKTYSRAKELMELVGIHLSHNMLVKDIGVGHQQLIEIAKALSKNVKLLILDEPTAALNDEDSEHLLNLLQELNQKQGLSCIIISHKLNEVTKISDEITVIRDGTTVETLTKANGNISEDRIIKGMVGRELVDRYPKRQAKISDIAFEIKNWSVYEPMDETKKRIKHVNMCVRKGEIVGIAGLMGAGRTELAMSIFGGAYGSKREGELYKDGKVLQIKTIEKAIQHGIAYLTEDRKNAGLILNDDIRRNITMANLQKISHHSVVNMCKELRVAEEYKKSLHIKAPNVMEKTGNLSGGNQQKVCIAKWLFSDPDILFLDEPTRGIDVGAKYEIYTIIHELASQGKCVVVISSELPELLGISDRIYVMNEGEMIAEMSSAEANQEKIMQKIITHGNVRGR